MEGNTKRPTITLEQDPTTKTWEALIESKRKRTRVTGMGRNKLTATLSAVISYGMTLTGLGYPRNVKG